MSTDASEHQLPSKWNAKDRSPLLEVGQHTKTSPSPEIKHCADFCALSFQVSLGLRVKYVGSGDSDKDAASVK